MTGTVLIWGGSGGIGAATARALVGQGQPVHLVGRDAGKLAALGEELGARWSLGDVEDDAAFARVTAEAGPLSALVYAVGSITLRPLGKLTTADFRRDFRLNAEGAALAVQAALPALKVAPGGGAVLLFSSVAVAQGFPSHASIGMAKGAVEGLVRSLAAELAPRVRVNAIAPSLTRTPLASALTGSETMAASIAQMHALQRLGEPEDIAALAALLVSPGGGWITGQVMGVDGGRSSLRSRG